MLNDLAADGKRRSIIYTRELAHEQLKALSNYEQDSGNHVSAWKAWLIAIFLLYKKWVKLSEKFDS